MMIAHHHEDRIVIEDNVLGVPILTVLFVVRVVCVLVSVAQRWRVSTARAVNQGVALS